MLKNIGEMLVLNVNRYPDKTAVVYGGQRFTYRELNERANRLAHHLLDMGAKKGDRVGFIFYNCNQYCEIFYATVKIGAVAVPLNFRMVPREIKWSLDNSGCKVLVYGQACANQVDPVKKELSTVEHLIYSGKEAPSGEHHFETLSMQGNAEEPPVEVVPEDNALIMFTGGTTGFPKGALHTHRSQMDFWTISMISTHMSTPSECSLIQVPLFHNAGLMYLSNTLMVGGKLVLVETFDPVELLRMIDQEKATYICLLPPAGHTYAEGLRHLVRHPRGDGRGGLHQIPFTQNF